MKCCFKGCQEESIKEIYGQMHNCNKHMQGRPHDITYACAAHFAEKVSNISGTCFVCAKITWNDAGEQVTTGNDTKFACKICSASMSTCSCGSRTHESTLIVESDHLCKSCWESKTKECKGCRKRAYTEAFIQIESGEYVCAECAKDYSKCPMCSKHRKTSSMKMLGQKMYCPQCYAQEAYECDGCGKIVAKSTMEGTRNGGEGPKCKECVFMLKKALDCKIDPITNNVNPYKRMFSIELESNDVSDAKKMEGRMKHWKNTEFYVEHDGSVPGSEFILSKTAGDAALQAIKKFLESSKFETNTQCGYHIHVDARDFNIDTFNRMFQFLSVHEETLFSFLPPGRRQNENCKRSRWYANKEFKDLESMGKAYYGKPVIDMHPDKKHDQGYGHGVRYEWLNIHSFFFRQTVEIRNHSGTFNYEKIINWMYLWMAIVDMAKTESQTTLANKLYKENNLSDKTDNFFDILRQYMPKKIFGRVKNFYLMRQMSLSEDE